MLEKFITNIKNSLSKKKSEEIVDDASESSEESQDVESEEANDKDDSNSNESKNKKGSMIIKVIVILGIVYLAVDQFLLKSDNADQVVANTPARPKRKRPIKPTPGTEKPAENDASAKNEIVQDSKHATPESTGSVTAASDIKEKPSEANVPATTVTEAPVENINIAPKLVEKNADTIPPESLEETKATKKMSLGESKSIEKDIDKQIDQMIEKDNGKTITEKKPEEDLKSKIAVEDTYIDPPSYEEAGRGLVYNCKERYWVCVDKPSYITCNKNMKYNKSHDKKIECAVVNVYNSNEDCSMIQKYYVSTNKSTEFCN